MNVKEQARGGNKSGRNLSTTSLRQKPVCHIFQLKLDYSILGGHGIYTFRRLLYGWRCITTTHFRFYILHSFVFVCFTVVDSYCPDSNYQQPCVRFFLQITARIIFGWTIFGGWQHCGYNRPFASSGAHQSTGRRALSREPGELHKPRQSFSNVSSVLLSRAGRVVRRTLTSFFGRNLRVFVISVFSE